LESLNNHVPSFLLLRGHSLGRTWAPQQGRGPHSHSRRKRERRASHNSQCRSKTGLVQDDTERERRVPLLPGGYLRRSEEEGLKKRVSASARVHNLIAIHTQHTQKAPKPR
jgi:hypothetical protein